MTAALLNSLALCLVLFSSLSLSLALSLVLSSSVSLPMCHYFSLRSLRAVRRAVLEVMPGSVEGAHSSFLLFRCLCPSFLPGLFKEIGALLEVTLTVSHLYVAVATQPMKRVYGSLDLMRP